MNKNQKQSQKQSSHQNILESLKDIGSSTSRSLTQEVIKPKDFLDQILGQIPQKYSGEIGPGEAVEMRDVFSGKRESEEKIKKQLSVEKTLLQEEKIRIEKKTNELKIQLKEVMKEVSLLSQSTQELSEDIKIASVQAPVEPGVYHIIFFEKLIEFIKSFRKKVQDASNWLQSTNKRAQKKNYWARYKKHGAKFLLSSEHYLTRSAG